MNLRKLLFLTAVIFSLVLVACVPVATPAGGTEAAMPASQTCNLIEVGEKDGMPDLQGCTLRIAVENAYQPFNYIDPDTKKAVGYDYDIFAEICTRINCQPEFVETSWDAMVALMGGQGAAETFDVGADGITITEARAEHVDFSIPYIASQQMLLVRADETRFVEPGEFVAQADLKMGTQIGTTNYDAAADLIGADRIVAFDQFGPAVQALINGDVDAVIIDNVSGLGYVGANPDKVKLTGEPVKSEDLGFMFPKGSPLKAPIDTALESMQADGKMDELYKQWFEAAQ